MKNKFLLITIAVFICCILLHGINMLNYPYYENDEGTYLSQAYAVGYLGKITNYTYWYDHAPVGWIIIAAWLRLTGGPFAFEYSFHSGRVLMLLTHAISCLLIYFIVKRLVVKDWVALLSIILFSISPLAIYFHRRLLLDNIMTLFLLGAIWAILYAKSRLKFIFLAGILFTISFLSKENAAITLPAFLYLTYKELKPQQRLFGLLNFIFPVFLGGMYYILFAYLKGELFPGVGHTSLIGSLQYQMSRGSGYPFYHPLSDFMTSFKDWIGRDLIFIAAGLISSVVVFFHKKTTVLIRAFVVIGLLLFLFLIRGGLVINFYIVPLLPFFAVVISILISWLSYKNNILRIGLIIIFILYIGFLSKKTWLIDEATPQRQSIEWIKKNLPETAVMAVDNSQLLDLQLSRYEGDKSFPNAHWFWKVDKDLEIRNRIVKDDWRNISYLILTHEYVIQVNEQLVPFIKNALDYSTPVVSWGPLSKETYLHIPRRISTNGDWVHIYRVMDEEDITLQNAWNKYKELFITYEGQVKDPQQNHTTSEGQSYALLRSVIMGDRDMFDLVWNWTTSHLQYRNEDRLFSWKWAPIENGIVTDPGFATDADIDIATALILASKTWNDTKYLEQAKVIVKDIWRQAVKRGDNGKYYLMPGGWGSEITSFIINPSYLSPAQFKLFSEIDPLNRWEQLADDSYDLLFQIQDNSVTGLPPDWIQVQKINGRLSVPSQLSSDFSFDAMRTMWRIALDWYWFKDPRAQEYLSGQKFLLDSLSKDGKLTMGYTRSGEALNEYESAGLYGSLLPAISIVNNEAGEITAEKLQTRYLEGIWDESDNYFTQNWAWLGMALYNNKIIYTK